MSCLHRTEGYVLRGCSSCQGNVQVKVYGCALYSECTLVPTALGLRDCSTCPNNTELAETVPVYAPLEKFLSDELPKVSYPVDKFSGRGIVIGAGGHKFFICAWNAVYILRSLGCTLPIEFWYLDRSEFDPIMEQLCRDLGVTAVNASAVLGTAPRILNGWELKPFSVIHSSFEEVFYIDADNIATMDPTYLFSEPEYLRTGAVFWSDLPPFQRAEWVPAIVWKHAGMQYRVEPDFESGQFLIDKRRCWRELSLTMHLNEHSDFWYKIVYGDKTTYHLAWRKLGTDYAMPPMQARWKSPAILQFDFQNRLLFQHCCQGKEKITAGHRIPNLIHGEIIPKAHAALTEVWNGEIWSWAGQDEEELETARNLCGVYRYTRVGIDNGADAVRCLELLPEGKIGMGGAACEKRWSLHNLKGVPTLVIVGEAHKGSEIGMMFLAQTERGWEGRWWAHERGPVILTKL